MIDKVIRRRPGEPRKAHYAAVDPEKLEGSIDVRQAAADNLGPAVPEVSGPGVRADRLREKTQPIADGLFTKVDQTRLREYRQIVDAAIAGREPVTKRGETIDRVWSKYRKSLAEGGFLHPDVGMGIAIREQDRIQRELEQCEKELEASTGDSSDSMKKIEIYRTQLDWVQTVMENIDARAAAIAAQEFQRASETGGEAPEVTAIDENQ